MNQCLNEKLIVFNALLSQCNAFFPVLYKTVSLKMNLFLHLAPSDQLLLKLGERNNSHLTSNESQKLHMYYYTIYTCTLEWFLTYY